MARDRRMPIRTRLLLGLAVLSVGAAVAAAAGVGRHAGRLPEVAAATPVIPAGLSDGAQSRLGPLQQYMVIGQTPLFYPDRQPRPFVANTGPAADRSTTSTFDFQLTGVIDTPEIELAVLQPVQGGEAVRVLKGSAPKGADAWILQGVDGRTAIFIGPGGEQRLELRRPVDAAPPPPPMPTAAAPPPPPPPSSAMPPPPMQMPPAPPPTATANVPPPTAPPDSTQPTDAQIEAIRARIQARRAELARERARQRQ